MAKLPNDFDWRRSQGHIYLLSRFTSPHDVEAVKGYQYGFQELKESISAAMERLFRDGAIEECSLAEKIAYSNKVTDLRTKLKALGLKTGGTKDELIQRLIEADARNLEKEYAGEHIAICSAAGIAVLEQYEQEKDAALKTAKQTIFDCLVKLEIIPAKKAYTDYIKNWEPSRAEYASNDYQFGNLRQLMEKSPKRLAEKYEPQLLRKLHAAAAMDLFWRNEPVWEWISDEIGLETEEVEEAMQLIERYQKYLDLLDDWSYQRTGIRFGQDNPNVCDNCRKLEGVKPDKKTAAEWPFEGCTNPVGCLPLRSYEIEDEDDFDDEDEEFNEGEEDEEDEEGVTTFTLPGRVDFLELLRQLKGMLDEGLITDEEYQAKKADILARM